MPHAHLLCISKTEEHLADLITYKKLDSDPTKPIRKDFLHSAQQLNHRTRNNLNRRGLHIFLLRSSLFYVLPKIYITYHCLPNSISNQYYQYVIVSPTSSQTMSPTAYNLMTKTPIINPLQLVIHKTS